MFEFADSKEPIHAKNINILYRTKIRAFLFFCLNLVAMATPFAPSKFLLAYLNSPFPKTLLYTHRTRKHCLDILYRSEICAILVYVCLILVHGNSLGSLENSGSIF